MAPWLPLLPDSAAALASSGGKGAAYDGVPVDDVTIDNAYYDATATASGGALDGCIPITNTRSCAPYTSGFFINASAIFSAYEPYLAIMSPLAKSPSAVSPKLWDEMVASLAAPHQFSPPPRSPLTSLGVSLNTLVMNSAGCSGYAGEPLMYQQSAICARDIFYLSAGCNARQNSGRSLPLTTANGEKTRRASGENERTSAPPPLHERLLDECSSCRESYGRSVSLPKDFEQRGQDNATVACGRISSRLSRSSLHEDSHYLGQVGWPSSSTDRIVDGMIAPSKTGHSGILVSMEPQMETSAYTPDCRMGVDEDLGSCGFGGDLQAAVAYCADEPYALCCDHLILPDRKDDRTSNARTEKALKNSALGRLLGYKGASTSTTANTAPRLDHLFSDASTELERDVNMYLEATEPSQNEDDDDAWPAFWTWENVLNMDYIKRSLAAYALADIVSDARASSRSIAGSRMGSAAAPAPPPRSATAAAAPKPSPAGAAAQPSRMTDGAIVGLVFGVLALVLLIVGATVAWPRLRRPGGAAAAAAAKTPPTLRRFVSIEKYSAKSDSPPAAAASPARPAAAAAGTSTDADVADAAGGANPRVSVESEPKSEPDVPIVGIVQPRLRVVEAEYEAVHIDEIGLSVGDVVQVMTEYDDGWATGRNVTTGKVGTFPMICLDGAS
ncbi:hypothetical protein DFJ73DRAFT_957535 [Zopfochytrium polystomum]|nr:hypothetical protein DFJ73DRAFT_957535 [Zopfochytrium polystomum]